MKIAIFTNSDIMPLASLLALNEKGLLAGVVIPARNAKILKAKFLSIGIAETDMYVMESADSNGVLPWLQHRGVQMAWVFTFPWKIPPALFNAIPGGFFNVHFGSLPEYAGADPVFWQIRNNAGNGGYAVHKITTEVDKGPILYTEKIPVIPGEIYGMYCLRLANAVAGKLDHLMALTEQNDYKPQSSVTENLWWGKPTLDELTINWEEQEADRIEWLVNAANPRYDGAVTQFANMEVRILEVTPADVTDAGQYEPGTIVHSDAVYGLIVACINKKFLRINIMHIPDGYVSGVKMSTLGLRAGERFTSKQKNQPSVGC